MSKADNLHTIIIGAGGGMTIGCLTAIFVAVVLVGAVCFVLAFQNNRRNP
jgi:hypothetical protein